MFVIRKLLTSLKTALALLLDDEQRTENPCVRSSNLRGTTLKIRYLHQKSIEKRSKTAAF